MNLDTLSNISNLIFSEFIDISEIQHTPWVLYWDPALNDHMPDKPDYVPDNVEDYEIHVKKVYLQIAKNNKFINEAIYCYPERDGRLVWAFEYASSRTVDIQTKFIEYNGNVTPEEFGVLITMNEL